MGFDLSHPPFHILKRSSVDDGIRENDACSPFIVSLCDVLESFLPGSIPDLQLVTPVADINSLHLEIYTDGRHIWFLEITLAKSSYEVGLADATVSYDDDFGHEIILIWLFFLWHGLLLILKLSLPLSESWGKSITIEVFMKLNIIYDQRSSVLRVKFLLLWVLSFSLLH